jgi:transmembrane sensor
MEKMEEEKNTVNDLIICYLNGTASIKDIEILKEWVNRSKENSDEFSKLRLSWLASAQVQYHKAINVDQALLELNRKINCKKQDESRFSLLSIRQLVKIAATFLLMIVLGSLGTYFLMKYNSSSAQNNNLTYVYAPRGSKVITILPDGTKVWLNAGSNLMYDPDFFIKRNRNVTLIGEGYFHVAHNAKRPFVVNAKNLEIVALGTEFNVKAYPDEDEIETTLVKGIVRINGRKQNRKSFSVTLKPKQQIVLPGGKSTINHIPLTDPVSVETKQLSKIRLEETQLKKANEPSVTNLETTELITSWTGDHWIFKGENLGKLTVLLERRFNIKIKFNSEELKEYMFTGTFQNETIEQILQVLKLTTPMQYEIGKGEIILNLDTRMKKKYEKYMN